MTDFLNEQVPPVNPLSMASVDELARCFLEQFSPETLANPGPLDISKLINEELPEYGIHVYPASREEIGDRSGATDPAGNNEIIILVSEEVWDNLEKPAPECYYAKTTICHEIGHAVLHVPIIRRKLLRTEVLSLVKRGNIPAYEDPEWQAWAFAGALLIPSVMLNKLKSTKNNNLTVEMISSIFEVSKPMVRSHLKRLKW